MASNQALGFLNLFGFNICLTVITLLCCVPVFFLLMKLKSVWLGLGYVWFTLLGTTAILIGTTIEFLVILWWLS